MPTEGERLATIEANQLASTSDRARMAQEILAIQSCTSEIRHVVSDIKVNSATIQTNQSWVMESLKRIEAKVDGLGHHSEISGHQHIIHNGKIQKVAVLGGGVLTGAGAVLWGIGRALGWW